MQSLVLAFFLNAPLVPIAQAAGSPWSYRDTST